MTFSNTNLEKLIQMASIEQMYSMLQKLKENVDNFNEYNFEEKKKATNINTNVNTNAELVTEIKTLHFEIRNITDNLQNYNDNILKLNIKITELEKELHEIKSNTNNNSKFLCQQIRGQQSLSSYPGFSNGTQDEKKVIKIKEEPNIILKIEEKTLNDTNNINKQSLFALEQIAREEEDEEEEDDKEEEEEEDDKEEEEKEELEEEEEEEEEGEESEEEVGTDDDESKDLEKEMPNVKQLQKEDEQEEEEVFEIEIDDIPYFVTDEENGILYEITSDGDIGKKVGIIKNGEPIFN